MCGDEFDLSEIANTLKSGLETLRVRRERLIQQQTDIEEDLDTTTKEMAKLDVMLRAYDLAEEKDKPEPEPQKPTVRVRGVKKSLKKLAEELTTGVVWGEDHLIGIIQAQIPGAKEVSIKDAIRTLGREGVFIRTIHEGSYVCETTIGKPQDKNMPDGNAIKATVKVGTDDDPTSISVEYMPIEKAKAQETKQYNLLPEAEIVVMGEAEIIVALEKEMKKRDSFPMGEKNIGWIATDLGVEPKNVRDALKVMVTGNWEFAYEGETKVLRQKAETGSKEELKRTQIKDQPLFPDADRPPFA